MVNVVGHKFMVVRHKFNMVGHNFMVLRHKFNVVGHESSTRDFTKTTNAPLKRTSAQYCSRSSEKRSSENTEQAEGRGNPSLDFCKDRALSF